VCVCVCVCRWQGVYNGKVGWFPKVYVDDTTVEVAVSLRWGLTLGGDLASLLCC
jgi:hypothetical protein